MLNPAVEGVCTAREVNDVPLKYVNCPEVNDVWFVPPSATAIARANPETVFVDNTL